MLIDPEFAGKCTGVVKGNIRPCLACAEGCLGGVKSGKGLRCLVNPQVGMQDEVIEKAEKSKRIAVVGGGLAGMEAALTLKKRGHSVTLFEKDTPGGQFVLAHLTPNKKSMGTLVPYFVEELQDNGIEIDRLQHSMVRAEGCYSASCSASPGCEEYPSRAHTSGIPLTYSCKCSC